MFIEIKTQEEAGEEVPRGGWCRRAWTRTAALGGPRPRSDWDWPARVFPRPPVNSREVFGGGGKKIFLIKKKNKEKKLKPIHETFILLLCYQVNLIISGMVYNKLTQNKVIM